MCLPRKDPPSEKTARPGPSYCFHPHHRHPKSCTSQDRSVAPRWTPASSSLLVATSCHDVICFVVNYVSSTEFGNKSTHTNSQLFSRYDYVSQSSSTNLNCRRYTSLQVLQYFPTYSQYCMCVCVCHAALRFGVLNGRASLRHDGNMGDTSCALHRGLSRHGSSLRPTYSTYLKTTAHWLWQLAKWQKQVHVCIFGHRQLQIIGTQWTQLSPAYSCGPLRNQSARKSGSFLAF